MKQSLLLVSILLSSNLLAHDHNKQPEAKLRLSDHECKSPCTVTLDGSKSEATKGKTITKYIFDLGNGEIIESSTPSIEYTYINFVEDKDPKKKVKYKKWKKFIDWCHSKFKKYEKFEPSLKIVQSDNQTSKPDEKKLLVKGTDVLPTIDGDDLVPPKPNQALSDSTLLGTDLDGDLVRDDVELFINKSTNNVGIRLAQKQVAKGMTIELAKLGDNQAVLAAIQVTLRALSCLSDKKAIANQDFTDYLGGILKVQYNTIERIKAHRVNEKLSNGLMMPNHVNPCDTN